MVQGMIVMFVCMLQPRLLTFFLRVLKLNSGMKWKCTA